MLGVILVDASLVPLTFSPMVFDSGESATAWGVFIAIWLFPVVLIAGLVVAWIGYAKRAHRMVWAGMVMAVLPAILAVGIFIMAW